MSAVAVAEADAAVAEAERAIAAASLDESGDTRVPKGGFRVDAMSMKEGEVCRGSVSQPRDGSVPVSVSSRTRTHSIVDDAVRAQSYLPAACIRQEARLTCGL